MEASSWYFDFGRRRRSDRLLSQAFNTTGGFLFNSYLYIQTLGGKAFDIISKDHWGSLSNEFLGPTLVPLQFEFTYFYLLIFEIVETCDISFSVLRGMFWNRSKIIFFGIM